MVSYIYDSWGKLLGVTGSLASTIGNLNPFRYRGYYYDSETGLYYLQSRYYDPDTGRFLNADAALGANGDILSYNLFTYCSNNPVNYSDPSGYGTLSITFTRETICWAIGAIAGALTKWAITALLSSIAVSIATAIQLGTAGVGTLIAGLVIYYGSWAATAVATAVVKNIAGRIYKGGDITFTIASAWYIPDYNIRIFGKKK